MDQHTASDPDQTTQICTLWFRSLSSAYTVRPLFTQFGQLILALSYQCQFTSLFCETKAEIIHIRFRWNLIQKNGDHSDPGESDSLRKGNHHIYPKYWDNFLPYLFQNLKKSILLPFNVSEKLLDEWQTMQTLIRYHVLWHRSWSALFRQACLSKCLGFLWYS